MRTFIPAAIAALGLCTFPAQAETLQKKFGPGWNCSYISVELDKLYDKCMQCESQGEDVAQVEWNKGECRNRLSLRENLITRPDYESPQEERMRLNSAAAAARELQEFQRWRNQRTPLESDVSGTGGGRLAPSAPRPHSSPPSNSFPTRESGVSGARDGSNSNSPEIGSKPSVSNVSSPTHPSPSAPVGGVHIGAAPTGKESDLSELRRKILNLKKPDT
ncbi:MULTISPECIES: hypothetical protein [unclassified Bradyrhizobium]|uniref:hypothetical protein n=1 Tax=unclassified Bradyrhizobium TaxID=2631580 RepID=UPI001FF6972D|nr:MULTISPECIES: hypothetical protein [unclassified Bradyrhizobium]MCJ9705644.1 hypothetical protein [Bradyrhizobium sp. SHOUNA76]MCJ9734046.1 hypothetical protein [Bradyrhizobium sp. PRIMUS42]